MKFLKWLIRKLVTFYYRVHPFYTYSWGVDENLDLIILSEESYLDYHRYGLREEKYDDEKQKWVRINSIVKESEEEE